MGKHLVGSLAGVQAKRATRCCKSVQPVGLGVSPLHSRLHVLLPPLIEPTNQSSGPLGSGSRGRALTLSIQSATSCPASSAFSSLSSADSSCCGSIIRYSPTEEVVVVMVGWCLRLGVSDWDWGWGG